MNYENIIVKKPWGFEYLLYQNQDVGIWYLSIKHGAKTSLHSHPNKKTGLVVLSGLAKVSFMNGFHELSAGEKIMIRNGVFHSTEALSGDIQLLEMETPNNKEDIIRLEDSYGRAGSPYEDASHHMTGDKFNLNSDVVKIGDCTLTKYRLNRSELIDRSDSNIMILEGMIFFKDFCVCGPGDIIDSFALSRLASKFDSTPMSILEVKKA